MKIVMLDGHTINPGDLSWDALSEIGELEVYDATEPDQMLSRIGDAEILLTSKCLITRDLMMKCPSLKYIGSMATGYNNIDVDAAGELGIAVTYIPAYSTDAVAQHTIALILELCNHAGLHNTSAKKGDWHDCPYFCYWKEPLVLLKGKSLGIVGYGQIGRRVAEIAKALGMEIHVYSKEPDAAVKSDFVTLHCPLTKENANFVNTEFIERMKPGAVLINTARGGLVDEAALADALKSGRLRAAAVDVLAQEPPSSDHPLIALENCIITPHLAWTPTEMRQTICRVLADNLSSFLQGGTLNRVDL